MVTRVACLGAFSLFVPSVRHVVFFLNGDLGPQPCSLVILRNLKATQQQLCVMVTLGHLFVVPARKKIGYF